MQSKQLAKGRGQRLLLLAGSQRACSGELQTCRVAKACIDIIIGLFCCYLNDSGSCRKKDSRWRLFPHYNLPEVERSQERMGKMKDDGDMC